MILGTMARGISNENCILAVRLPILLQSIFKASCNILWTVSTTCGFKLTQEFLASDNIIAKTKYL
jgi:hypothetical protein